MIRCRCLVARFGYQHHGQGRRLYASPCPGWDTLCRFLRGGFRSGTAVVGSKSGDTLYLESADGAPLYAKGRGTIEVYPLPQL